MKDSTEELLQSFREVKDSLDVHVFRASRYISERRADGENTHLTYNSKEGYTIHEAA